MLELPDTRTGAALYMESPWDQGTSCQSCFNPNYPRDRVLAEEKSRREDLVSAAESEALGGRVFERRSS